MTVVHDPKPPSDPSSSGSRWGRRNRSTAGGAPWLPILGLIVIAAGVAVWWFLLRGSPEATGSEAAGPPSASVPTGVSDTGPAELPALDLPPLAESDAVVRRVVGAISAHPRWAEWLVTDDLALRFVSSVANVAAGVSPASQVPFLAPEGGFAVVSSGAGTFIDPASYRRFDALVDAFVSFETTAAVDLYRQLLPLFDEAHRSLGFPEGTFNEVFDTALGRLTDVPVPDLPPAVELDVQTYLLVDASLESLSPAEKHVLRLGPDNARRVQQRLTDLRAGLERAGVFQSGR